MGLPLSSRCAKIYLYTGFLCQSGPGPDHQTGAGIITRHKNNTWPAPPKPPHRAGWGGKIPVELAGEEKWRGDLGKEEETGRPLPHHKNHIATTAMSNTHPSKYNTSLLISLTIFQTFTKENEEQCIFESRTISAPLIFFSLHQSIIIFSLHQSIFIKYRCFIGNEISVLS